MSTSSSLLVGLRGAVSCLVTFLIFVSSVSLLIGRRVQKSQVQLLVQHRHQQEAVTVAAAGNQESQVPWTDELKGEAARGSGEEECNLSVGRWVYDNTSQPMYSGHNCSFILGEVACQKYGQNNTKYQYWKWQPDGCDLPRYGTFEDGDAKLDEVEMVEGFVIALKKLTGWLETNIDNKTKIYFAGASPSHTWASDWGGDDSNMCLNETEPIPNSGYKGATTDYSMMDKAVEIFRPLEKKGIHVQILNFTQLSDNRIDAHPTIFQQQYGAPLTADQIANPSSYADCIHWCLPGVPDVWNQFLYSYLVHK